MTCAPYITQPGAVLGSDEPVAQAARLLAANGFAPIPVVEADRRLAGLFGASQLAKLLLPMGARLAGEAFDLSFVSEDPQVLRERLAAEAQAKVGEHVVAVEPIHAGTSVDEVLLRIHRGETFLPVVDGDGRLTGAVTAAAVLGALVEGV